MEAINRRPLLIELGKDLRVDGIALHHAVKVTGLLCFLWQLRTVGHVSVCKSTAYLVTRLGITDWFKQTPPDNLKSFLGCHGFPECLHPVKDRLQRLQRRHATRTTSLAIGFWQGSKHHSIRHQLGCLGQRLDERKVAVVGAAAERLALHELTDVNDELIQQHHTRREASQQRAEHILPWRRPVRIGLLHQRKTVRLAKLACQFAPERPNRLLGMLPRLAGGVGRAIQHGDLRLRHIHQPCLIKQCRDSGEVAQRALARGQMIDCQQCVRLATTEGSLQLDNRLAAFAIEPL